MFIQRFERYWDCCSDPGAGKIQCTRTDLRPEELKEEFVYENKEFWNVRDSKIGYPAFY